MFGDSVYQEFGQGTAGVACLCFAIAGATAGKTQMTGSDTTPWVWSDLKHSSLNVWILC